MLKRWTLAVFAVLLVGVPTFAQNGQHYNLNVIGVDKGKSPTMTDSNRHTIFVALGKKGGEEVTTRIFLTNGHDFRVCDGNGFDTAYDCNGAVIANEGAAFMLPCNVNPEIAYSDGYGCPGGTAERSYEVWARALGTPFGQSQTMTCATETESGEEFCATENVLTLQRERKRPTWQSATSELTTLEADLDDDGTVEVIALFAEGFEDFHWQYNNAGLRLAQIRFLPLD
jgi:hypothetical protein